MSNPEIDTDGNKYWYYRDKNIHRIEYISGAKAWYKNNKLHRDHGPALKLPDGTKEYWVNGKLHRVDGPAIECSSGYKYWYQNGKYHRLDGPAIESPSENPSYYTGYYINGKRYDSLEALLMEYALG